MKPAEPVSPATARTWADVDLGRIAANLQALKRLLPGPAEILMPVKANAYGHGLVPVARAALDAGAWGLGVATLDEVDALRSAGIAAPVVCLMPVLPIEAERAVRLDATLSISSLALAETLAAAARAAGRPTDVHVEVDTGMGRAGVWDREAVDFVSRVAELPGLRLEGMFTHFASADEADRSATDRQLDRFDALLEALADRGVRPPRIHVANSAAALRFRRASRPLLRPGIALYGSTEEIAGDTDVGPGGALDAALFEAALAWHARVLAVKTLAAGDRVSYHGRYVAGGAERIALLGVGYGDGWPHSLSNRGHVLLRGRAVPIRGAVCMDLTMVDATPFPDLEVGEIATLIGGQGTVFRSAAAVAREAGVVSYAVFTGIADRVHRRYTNGRKETDDER